MSPQFSLICSYLSSWKSLEASVTVWVSMKVHRSTTLSGLQEKRACVWCAVSLLSMLSLQGLCVMLVFTVFNTEFKEAWGVACLGKKSPGEDPPRPPQNTVSCAHTLLLLTSAHPQLVIWYCHPNLNLLMKSSFNLWKRDCTKVMGSINETVTSLATFLKPDPYLLASYSFLDAHSWCIHYRKCANALPPSTPPSLHPFIYLSCPASLLFLCLRGLSLTQIK